MNPVWISLICVVIFSIFQFGWQYFYAKQDSINIQNLPISINRIHSISSPLPQQSKQSYNSLYQAIYYPQKPKIQRNIPFNSMPLKLSILKKQYIKSCSQHISVIIDEGVNCDNKQKQCKWQSILNIYRMPYLKYEDRQILKIEGKLVNIQKQNNKIICLTKFHMFNHYQQLKLAVQTNKNIIYHTIIIKNFFDQESKTIKFHLEIQKIQMKTNQQILLLSQNNKCFSILQKFKPWQIQYNCLKQSNKINVLIPQLWKKINLLDKNNIQLLHTNRNKLIQKQFSSGLFSVKPIYMKNLQSSFQNYIANKYMKLNNNKKISNFLTVVFQIRDPEYFYGVALYQMTIDMKNGKIISFSLLNQEANPHLYMKIDCLLTQKINMFFKGVYEYQLSAKLARQKSIGSYQKHELLCVVGGQQDYRIKNIRINDVLGLFKQENIPRQYSVFDSKLIQQIQVLRSTNPQYNILNQQNTQQQDSSWFDYLLPLFNLQDQQQYYNPQIDFNQQFKNNTPVQSKKQFLEMMFQSFDNIGQKINQLSAQIFYAQILILFRSNSKITIIDGNNDLIIIHIGSARRFYLLCYKVDKNEQGNKQVLKKSIEIGQVAHKLYYGYDSSLQQKFLNHELSKVSNLDPYILEEVKSWSLIDSYPKKQIIIIWGWGIQVYQIKPTNKIYDWDKLSQKNEGIQMATIIPFIQLFATIYCIFLQLFSQR